MAALSQFLQTSIDNVDRYLRCRPFSTQEMLLSVPRIAQLHVRLYLLDMATLMA